jgi:hypothetical protein
VLGGDVFDVAADDALERLEVLLDLANLVGVVGADDECPYRRSCHSLRADCLAHGWSLGCVGPVAGALDLYGNPCILE